MRVHADGWIKNALSTEPCNRDAITDAVKRLYTESGLKEPRVVVVSSPYVMAMAGGFAAGILYLRTRAATYAATYAATRDATDAATDDAITAATRDATYAAITAATYAATISATRDATISATRDATYAAITAATSAATRAAIDDATYAATRDATDAATDAATDDAITAAIDDAAYAATRAATSSLLGMAHVAEALSPGNSDFLLECARKWSRLYQGGNMWSPWVCYLTAFRDVLGQELPIYEKFAPWEELARLSGFRMMHADFCIVSDRPNILKIDDQNRPHCDDGPSHQWRDGWSLYHWHGVSIPAEWIEDKTSLTPAMALTWENIEQRRAACEILGWHNILQALDAKVIDRDADPMIGELLEVGLPDIGTERFLRVVCGTGRIFAIPVPPDMRTALQANAWTYDVPTDFIANLEVRT
jgi:hypothetical protein